MKKINSGENNEITELEKANLKKKLEAKFEEALFEIMPFKKDDDNFTKTPHRLSKMWIYEVFNGCFDKKPRCTSFHNKKDIDQIVVLGPMKMKSMCAHHFMPFFGDVYFAYKINDKLIGASKPERMLDWVSRRPQTQEFLLSTFVNEMKNVLETEDVMAVALNVQHTCMTHRGVGAHETSMMNSEGSGVFRNAHDNASRTVFEMIKMRK